MKVAGVVGIYKFSCRLVRMFTATKSFEIFRQPKSVQDEKRSVDNAVLMYLMHCLSMKRPAKIKLNMF